jgi:hypothetical protein
MATTYQETDGDNQEGEVDPVARIGVVDQDEECVEELFGQLWAIPKSKPRVPTPHLHGGRLIWKRRDLVRERRVHPEDCFPMSRSQRDGKVSTTLSFMKDMWAGGERATYKEVFNSIPMTEGGDEFGKRINHRWHHCEAVPKSSEEEVLYSSRIRAPWPWRKGRLMIRSLVRAMVLRGTRCPSLQCTSRRNHRASILNGL